MDQYDLQILQALSLTTEVGVSFATLASLTGFSMVTVSRHIAYLRGLGYVSQGVKNGYTTYRSIKITKAGLQVLERNHE